MKDVNIRVMVAGQIAQSEGISGTNKLKQQSNCSLRLILKLHRPQFRQHH
jgi:hypothetical protein